MIRTETVILPMRPRKVAEDNQKLRAPLILLACWHFVGNVVSTGLGSRDSGCQPTPHGQLGQFLPSCCNQKLRPDYVSLLKYFCFIHAVVQTPSLCSRVLTPLTQVSLLSVWVFSVAVVMPFYPCCSTALSLDNTVHAHSGVLIASLPDFNACTPVLVCFSPAPSFSKVCEFLVLQFSSATRLSIFS